MHKTLIVAAFALVCSSCAEEKCQAFNRGGSSVGTGKLGIGYEATLIVGSGEDPLEVSDVPPGMTVDTAGGTIRVTGTPTRAGDYQVQIRPRVAACEHDGTSLANLVVPITVAPADCDDPTDCRLLARGPCTQSSACVPSPPYVTSACIATLGDAGVCVDVNAPADQCGSGVTEMMLTTVEGTQVESCIAAPAITGCNHHVCSGAP